MTEPLLLRADDAAGGGAAARVVRPATRREARPRVDARRLAPVRAGVPDALRGLAGHRRGARRGRLGALAARRAAAAALRGASRRSPSTRPSAIVGFMVFSRVVVGAWFVPSGFFVPENPAQGHPLAAVAQIVWGARTLSGYGCSSSRSPAAGAARRVGLARSRGAPSRSSPLALAGDRRAAVARVPRGPPVPHPLHGAAHRGRGRRRRRRRWARAKRRARLRWRVALLALVVAASSGRSTDGADGRRGAVGSARTSRRAQHGHRLPARRATTARRSWRAWDRSATTCRSCRARASTLRDFLHEGNGDIWLGALERAAPVCRLDADRGASGRRRHAGAASRARTRDSSTGSRACARAAGVALYRRDPSPGHPATLEPHVERRRGS